MGYYLAVKENDILPFVTAWVDLEGVMLSEISQRKTNTIWFHLNVESKIQNKQTRQKQTHRYRERTDGHQTGENWRRWVKKVKGLKMYKLPVIKIITGI